MTLLPKKFKFPSRKETVPRSRWVWLALLMVIPFFLYWKGMVDFPRKDQLPFLAEKTFFSSNLDWIIHTLSFNRTRLTSVGDYFLFRPIHMFLLSVVDILFRNQLLVSGAISLFYLGLAGAALFLLARSRLGGAISFLISLCFMAQNASQEIVLWRHISPYLLALFFWGIGTKIICCSHEQESTLTKRVGSLCLFVACCIHEIIAVGLIIGCVLIYFCNKTSNIKINGNIYYLLGMPVIAYVALDILDYFYYNTRQILGPADTLNDSGLVDIIFSVWSVHAASFLAFLFPFTVKLAYGRSGLLSWPFLDDQLLLNAAGICGLFIIVFLALYINKSLKTPGSTSEKSIFISQDTNGEAVGTILIVLLSISGYFAYLISIGIGRVYLRGVGYLYGATYYYAFSTFFILLIVAFGWVALGWASRMKKAFAILLTAAFFSNWYALNQKLDIYQKDSSANLSRIESIQRFFEINDKLCFNGFETAKISREYRILPFYIEDAACDTNLHVFSNYQSKVPVALSYDDNGLISYRVLPSVSATSQYELHGPQGLFLQTQPGWHAELAPNYPQTLLIDLHGAQTIGKIGFLPQDSNYSDRAPKKIRINVSSDGKSWVTVATPVDICDRNAPGGWHDVEPVKPVKARFVQVEILANCGNPRLLTLLGLRIEP